MTRARGICALLKEAHPTGELRRVFELGPGYGHNLRKIKEEYPSALIFSDELDEELKGLTGAQQANLQDGGYDAIILSHVLEHFTNPVTLVRQAVEALAPRGSLVIEVPNDFDGTSYITPHDEPHFTFYTIQTLRPLLETAERAEIVKMFTLGEREAALSPYRRLRRNLGIAALKVPYLHNFLESHYFASRSVTTGDNIRTDHRGIFLRAAMIRS
jgi:SAM-dependent methyltransferase